MQNLYKPSIIVAKNSEQMSREAAEIFVKAYEETITNRKQKYFTPLEKRGFLTGFTVAVSGGKSPEKFFRFLADPEYTKRVNWNKVQVFWADERAVPPSSSQSNYLLAWNNWLKPANVPVTNIHRIRGEAIFPKFEAWRYTTLLKRFLGKGGGFDLAVLGMGGDGHTMSIFPGSKLAISRQWGAVSVATPTGGEALSCFSTGGAALSCFSTGLRYTLTPEMIRRTKTIVVLAPGKAKRDLLDKLLGADYNPTSYPIQLVLENPNTVVVTTLVCYNVSQ